MQVPYLTGERIYLRRMRFEDKDYALAWLDSVFPISAARAEQILRDESTVSWHPPKIRLAVIRRGDDQIIGRPLEVGRCQGLRLSGRALLRRDA